MAATDEVKDIEQSLPGHATPKSDLRSSTASGKASSTNSICKGDVEVEELGTFAEISMGSKRKWFLVLIFSVCQYLDIASRASAVMFMGDISTDLGVEYETSTWILNSYGVTFGSFLLFWGRVADLYSAKPVFVGGFVVSALFSLVTSMVNNQYLFFVFRAIYGVFAAATIPSAFRLISALFEPGEVQLALAVYGVSGAFANATGLLLGGVFGVVKANGQMANWRWFMRFVAIASIPFATFAYFLLTPTKGQHANTKQRWRHLDLCGSSLILAALLLLNIGLTEGASRGWKTPAFLAPFCAAWPLAGAFFLWEWRMPVESAVLPKSLWKVPNIKLMCFSGLYLFAWVTCCQLVLVERYQQIFGESAIHSAVRMLPQGLSMCLFVIVISPMVKKMRNLGTLTGVSFLVAAASYVPLIYGDGEIGGHYWKYYLPSFIIGSIGMAGAFLGVNITIMTSVPSTMAGVAGALFQVTLQTGTVTALSIQAGLLTIEPGSIENYTNIRYSFWFQFGWGVLTGLLVLIFFRRRRDDAEDANAEDVVPSLDAGIASESGKRKAGEYVDGDGTGGADIVSAVPTAAATAIPVAAK